MKLPDTSRLFVTMMLFLLMTVGMASADIVYFTDFSTDPAADGWVGFVSGQWEWGSATASSGCSGNQDPSQDYSPSADNYIVGYEIGGCYPNSLPETYLTSPAFDCTSFDHVFIDFYRFLGVESATWDHASIRASTNGSTWTTVWDHTGGSFSDSSWTHMNYDISTLAAGQPMVYVRFVMGATDSSVTYCGWNIDDFTLIGADDGFLNGTVTDDTDAPIEGAVVTVVETGMSATTIADGTYNLPHLSGTYTVTCEALGHNMGTVSGVVITGGATTTQDFVLTYPIAGISPTSFSVELNLGETAEDYLYLENTGNGDFDFSLSFLPATDRGPQAYCIDLLNPRLYEIPDIDSPTTWNPVGGTLTGSFYAGDFINNDFTTLYVIDDDAYQLKAINTSTGAVTSIGACSPVSGHTWTGMAGAADGTMYMASTDGATSMLYTVNIGTGALTQIGTVTNSPLLIGIAINAQGEMYGVDIGSDSLVSINTSTGAATVIGSLGFDASYAQGMDFDFATGILYLAAYNVSTGGTAELRTANLATGATTLVGAFAAGTEIDAFAITSPASTWLTFDITEGSVAPGDTTTVTLTFDAGEVDLPGLYTGDISINHNFGTEEPVIIPVSMLVGGGGAMDGHVSDDGDAPIENAEVTIVEISMSTMTDASGYYSFPIVPAGTFTVNCEADGFNPASASGVVVAPGVTTTLDFHMTYPMMSVTPGDYTRYQAPDMMETIMDALTVSNTGTGDLEWSSRITFGPPPTDDLGSWTDITPVGPSVTQWPGSCFGEGKFFVVGGFTDITTGDIYDGIQIYDTIAGTWTASTASPTNVFSCVTEYYEGKVYVIGGYINDSFTATNLVQIYNIATNSWTTGATMPTARGGNSGGIIDGKIYSLGGSPDSNFPTENVAYEYDIATNTWATKTAGPISTYGISLGGGCEFNGKIYVGGHFASAYNQFYEFDPAGAGTWTTKAAVPTGIGGMTWSLIGLETEGYVLAVGGGNDWTATGTTFKYDPAVDTWTNLNAPMTTAVMGGGCAAGYGEIYFYGGTIGSGPVIPAPFMMNTFNYMSWLATDPIMGTVGPGSTAMIDLTFDTTAMAEGEYHADVTYTNEISGDTIVVPVTLFVSTTVPTNTPTSVPPTNTPTGGPTSTPTDTPTTGPTATPTEPPSDAIWVGDYSGCTGDTIRVRVMMANTTVPVDAFTMHLLFDTSMLQYESCVAGDLDPGWTLFDCNEASPGDVTIAGFSLPPNEIPAGSEGVLAELTFTVTCASCNEGDSCDLAPTNFRDDIEEFGAIAGSYTFTCVTPTPTSPPPTNTPTAVPPTNTPTPTTVPPTYTPTRTPTPTVPPTNTPTLTPTTVPPTNTPTPTSSPTTVPPTATPTAVECDWLGVHCEMSQTDPYQAGDVFWFEIHVCNNTSAMMTDIPTAVLLGVYGQYWFWPSWSMTFDYEIMDFDMGLTSFYALEPFDWPNVDGTVSGLDFYAALLTPQMDNIIGELCHVTFGYSD